MMTAPSPTRPKQAHRTWMACLHCREGKHRCDGTPPTELLDNSALTPTAQTPQGNVVDSSGTNIVSFGINGLDSDIPALIVPEQPNTAVQQQSYPSNMIQRYGEDRCSGCKAGHHVCIWVPKARLGRPRKRARASDPGQGSDLPEHTPPQLTTAQDELDINQNSTSSQTLWSPDAPASAASTQAEQDFQSLLSILQSSPKDHQQLHIFGLAQASNPNLQEIYLNAFFNHAAQFCAILGNPLRFKAKVQELRIASNGLLLDDFQQRQLQALSACVAVAVALGAHLCTTPDRASPQLKAELLANARNQVQACILNPPTNPITSHHTLIATAIHHIQAMIIASHLEYGLGNPAAARTALDSARNVALYHQLQHFDKEPDFLEHLIASNAADNSALADLNVPPLAPRLHAHLPGLMGQVDVVDDVRRVWWELCVLDAILDVATGASTATCLLSTHATRDTLFPQGDAGPDGLEAEKVATQTRIRAATVLVECTQPITNQAASRLVRLDALSTIISNMTVEAHHQWRTAPSPSSREASLMAFVMLHAARIQLYRLAALPEISFQLTSCSFEVKDRPATSPINPSSLHSTSESLFPELNVALAREVGIPQATQKIVESADAIMDMLRNEHQRLPFEARHSLLVGHSPFLSCSQVAAAWGYTVSAAIMRTELDSQAAGQVFSGSEAALSTLWRHRAILSNLSAALDSLQSVASLWPITAKMAEEVRGCRALVERTGSVGLL
ncbi:hypothetical protein OC861_006155 [Tilletia horrida]|nr:hypothetical protein OC861_006155 [Tilletia horrida]